MRKGTPRMLDSDLELIAQPVPNLEYLNGFDSYYDSPVTGLVFEVLAGITRKELEEFILMSSATNPAWGYDYVLGRVEYRARRQAEAYDRIAEELIGSAPPDPLALKGYCPESVEIVRSIISGLQEFGGKGE